MKLRHYSILFICLFILFVQNACKHEPFEPIEQPEPMLGDTTLVGVDTTVIDTTVIDTCGLNNISFETDIQLIFEQHCFNCHGDGLMLGDVDLSNYAGITEVALSGQLLGSITHNPNYVAMPLGGEMLSFCEIAQIETWILAGMPPDEVTDTTGAIVDTSGTGPVDTSGTGPIDTTITLIPCDPDSVYFTNTILPIFQSNCAFSGCHNAASAQDGVVLISYETALASGEITPFDLDESDVYEDLLEDDLDKRMPPPPYSPLPVEQIQLIGQWIQQGAQNNYCEECDTDNITFSNVVSPIIQLKCQGCHSGDNPQGGILLSNYSQIQIMALNGSLLGSISHSNGYTPMPFNGNQLPECEIDQISQWIADGAPNN